MPPVAVLSAVTFRHARHDPTLAVSAVDLTAIRCISASEFAVLQHYIDALCDGQRQPAPTHRDGSAYAARYVEEFMRSLPRRDLQDLRVMLRFVQHVAPSLVGSTQPFTACTLGTQKRILASIESSPSALIRTGFSALKQLTALGYWSNPQTWPAIGYDGPRVPSRTQLSATRPARSAALNLSTRTDWDVDVVVVGAGAGGSMVAREIARGGASVLLLEEGPDHPVESFSQREDEMIPELYQERGGRMNRERSLLLLQGRGLGGSTNHNQNLCKRIAPSVLEQWHHDGLDGWTEGALDAVFSQVERDLHVTTIADLDVTPQNDLLARGASALHWEHARLQHNRDGCNRSGFCELGCAYDGKNNARKVLLPQAAAAGAAIRANTRVDRVLFRNGAARGVLAQDTISGRAVSVRARAVVLAASAVGSAVIALRSGLPDPYGRLGRGLHVHPASVVAGIFSSTQIDGWRGIPQSVECTEWLDHGRLSDRRTWIVPAFAHPAATAAMMPGVGDNWLNAMSQYPSMAVLTAMVHDRTEGRVSLESGRTMIDYNLCFDDRRQLAEGLHHCAELLFAAGASRVMYPFAPARTYSAREALHKLAPSDIEAHALPMTAVHPMSSLRAGRDPRASVVSSTGEHHQIRGLFVADGSVFPTSIGGPPQIPIYAAGLKISRHILEFIR